MPAAPPPLPHRQRCHVHPEREAVGRCTSCGNYFCRECITIHDHRLICATCLKELLAKEAQQTKSKHRLKPVLKGLLGTAAGLLLAWALFYTLGSILLRAPSDFHPDQWLMGDEFNQP